MVARRLLRSSGCRACAQPRRPLSQNSIFTRPRGKVAEGIRMDVRSTPWGSQAAAKERLGEMAIAFSRSTLDVAVSTLRNPHPGCWLQPISSIFRNCRFPLLAAPRSSTGAGLPGRRVVRSWWKAHARAGAESACRQRRLVVQAPEARSDAYLQDHIGLRQALLPRASGTLSKPLIGSYKVLMGRGGRVCSIWVTRWFSRALGLLLRDHSGGSSNHQSTRAYER